MSWSKDTLTLSEFGCPLPKDCAFRWALAADWDTPSLEAEEVFIQRAVLKRQREFRAGRNTAHRCIADVLQAQSSSSSNSIKIIEQCIGMGEYREPLWPSAVVGSISHTQFECNNSHSTQEFCAVAVAPSQALQSLGLDIELMEHLTPESLDLIVTPAESRRAEEHCWPKYWPKYLFTVKESFYKCLFPLTGSYLDFLEAEFHLKAVKALPGVYEAQVMRVDSKDFCLNDDLKSRLKGYVFGDAPLIRAAFWLSH